MIWDFLCKGGIVYNDMDGPRRNASERSRPSSISSKRSERTSSERPRTWSVSSKGGEKTPPPNRRNTITASELLRFPGSRKSKTSVLVERISEYCNVYTQPMTGQVIQDVKVSATVLVYYDTI